MENMISKQELIRKIQELGFCAVDLNLFLDTHPTCTQALKDYNYVSQTLNQYKQLYNQKFGPLMNFGEDTEYGNTWTWVSPNEKWPWEGNV